MRAEPRAGPRRAADASKRAPVSRAVEPPVDLPQRGVIDLMRAIKSGEVAPSSLAPDDRRACVEHLTAEGYGVAEIASVLGIADRTVARDRQRIREANALARDPALVGEMAGRLLTEADTALSRLRRIGRDKETPAAAKVEAERSCWTVVRELVHTLQRLGYLPTAPMTLRADLGAASDPFGADDSPDIDELLAEAARLEAIARGSAPGISPGERQGCRPRNAPRTAPRTAARRLTGEAGSETDDSDEGTSGTDVASPALEELTRVKDELARLALGARLDRLSGQLAKEGRNDEHDDDD